MHSSAEASSCDQFSPGALRESISRSSGLSMQGVKCAPEIYCLHRGAGYCPCTRLYFVMFWVLLGPCFTQLLFVTCSTIFLLRGTRLLSKCEHNGCRCHMF